eukprot:3106285-Prymnesium_polylepis.2
MAALTGGGSMASSSRQLMMRSWLLGGLSISCDVAAVDESGCEHSRRAGCEPPVRAAARPPLLV